MEGGGPAASHRHHDLARIRNPYAPRRLAETRASAEGTFSFAHVPAVGFHQLDLSGVSIGLVGAIVEGYVCAPAEVPVPPDGAAVEVKVVCWPRAAIEGRVVDRQGHPLPLVSVMAYSRERPLGPWARLFKGGAPSTRTDKEGRFRIEGIAALRGGPSDVPVYAIPSWWPSMVGRSVEARATVSAGQTTTLPDIVVAPLDLPHVDVLVVDEQDRPVWNASVRFAYLSGGPRTDRPSA